MRIKNLTSLPFYLKLAAVLASLLMIGYIVVIAKEIIAPLIFSALFSVLLRPVASFFEFKVKLPRSASSMLSVIMFISTITFVMYVIGSQISDLANDWPQFETQVDTSIDNVQGWVAETFKITESKQRNLFRSAKEQFLSAGTAVAGATVVSSVLIFLVFTFIYTFFFLLYRRLILKFLETVFLDDNKNIVHDILEQIQYIIRKYIIGLIIEMVIVATAVSVAFWICGIQYAFLLGLITGLFNIIPYIGIFTALLLSCAITFATAAVTGKVFLVIIIMVIAHLIDSNILLPMVVGSKVRINALITVLGVIIGEMIWGIPGMFLSIPVIAVLKIIFDRVETLQAWGIILGVEEEKQKKLARKKIVTPTKPDE